MVLHRIIFALFLISFVVRVDAQTDNENFETFFQRWQSDALLKNASVGFAVADIATGEIIDQTSPQLSLVPASIMKVITTATALDILGADYTFKTTLAYTGDIDTVSHTLNGDLVLIGGGDPALGSMYFKDHYSQPSFFDQLLDGLKWAGISKIKGDLIADASAYEEQMVPGTWAWEDLGNYYGAGACALSVYDNMYTLRLSSGKVGDLVDVVSVSPEIPELQLRNEVTASSDNRDLAYVFGSPFEKQRVLRGTIPANRTNFEIKASMPDPPLLLISQLRDEMLKRDIDFIGELKCTYTPVEPVLVLAEVESPELSMIIEVTNHESVNLFAEHLCKHLAYVQTGLGTTRKGLEIIRKYWGDKGINTQGMFLSDGSGLSRFDALTAEQMTDILLRISQSPQYEVFWNSLPEAGSGTLSYFQNAKFPGESLRAKSGSMTRVRCFAGYLKTISGRELAFTIMLNNFSCSQSEAIRKAEELLVEMRKL